MTDLKIVVWQSVRPHVWVRLFVRSPINRHGTYSWNVPSFYHFCQWTIIGLFHQDIQGLTREYISTLCLSRWPDSNRRPGDYKSPALPAELHRHNDRVSSSFFAIYMPPNRIGKANQEQTLPVTFNFGIEPQSPVYLRVF